MGAPQVAVLAKKLTQERVSVSIEADALTVVVWDEAGQEEYRLDTPLYSRVITEGSRWELLSTKVCFYACDCQHIYDSVSEPTEP